MAKVDFIKIEGYALYVLCAGKHTLLTKPVIGIYVERGYWATAALTVFGDVVDLHRYCVLGSPDGKFIRARCVFKDQAAWLEWFLSPEIGDDDNELIKNFVYFAEVNPKEAKRLLGDYGVDRLPDVKVKDLTAFTARLNDLVFLNK